MFTMRLGVVRSEVAEGDWGLGLNKLAAAGVYHAAYCPYPCLSLGRRDRHMLEPTAPPTVCALYLYLDNTRALCCKSHAAEGADHLLSRASV